MPEPTTFASLACAAVDTLPPTDHAPSMDRTAALAELRAALETALATARAETQAARSGARVDEGHRPANRGERAAVSGQGALSGALAARARELEDALRLLDELAPGGRDRAGPGALVETRDEDGVVATWLIAPGGDGRKLEALEGGVAVSPASPIGRALHGAVEDDVVAFTRAGAMVEIEVIRVR